MLFSQRKQVTSKVLKSVLLNTFMNDLESIASKVSGVAMEQKMACNVTALVSSTFVTFSASENADVALRAPGLVDFCLIQ